MISKILVKKNEIILIVSILFFAFSFLVTSWFIMNQEAITFDGAWDLNDYVYYNDGDNAKVVIFGSDCTDSILWSYATLKEGGKLLGADFHYPCLLAFGGNLFFLPFLAIFGYGAMAQKCGMFLFLIVFTIALYFFFKAFSLKLSDRFFGCGIVLAVSMTGSIIRQIMWMHILYYNLGLLLFLLGATFMAFYMTKEEKKYLVLHAAVIGISVLNGFTQIAVVALPFIGAAFAEMFFFDVSKETAGQHKKLLIAEIVGLFLGGIIRFLIAHGVESSGYDQVYAKYGSFEDMHENIGKLISYWFALLGVNNTDDIDFFSVTGIKYGLFIVVGILILVVPFTRWLKKKDMEKRESALLVQYTILTAFIAFGYIFGRFSDSCRRLTENALIAVIITVIFLFREKEKYANKKCILRLFFIAFSAGFLLLFVGTTRKDESIAHRELAEYLKENNLNNGIAGYWDANVTAFYANDKVHIVPVLISDDNMVVFRYNTFKSWADEAGEKGVDFLVLRDEDFKELGYSLRRELDEKGIDEVVTEYNFHVIRFTEPYHVY